MPERGGQSPAYLEELQSKGYGLGKDALAGTEPKQFPCQSRRSPLLGLQAEFAQYCREEQRRRDRLVRLLALTTLGVSLFVLYLKLR